MIIQTLKGFRDFLPEQAKKRQYVIDTLRSVFTSYGFEPLETPALEYEEILVGKYGEEGDKLMYRFTDNGDRKVAMRYDQTVPLARVVAQYTNVLPLPFKRYQIQPVWRAENTQKGRFREFLQCDIDTVGSASSLADAEIIALVAKSYEALGLKNFKILVNDRTVFAGLTPKAIAAIDKLSKIGPEKVREELKQRGFNPKILDDILEKRMPDSLAQIVSSAKKLGAPQDRIIFSPTLARGLDYYTGLIIEVAIDNYVGGSVGGGGRYDNLIGLFLNKQLIPAIGFSFGFDRIIEAMEEQNLFPSDLSTGARVLVTVFNADLVDTSIEISSRLRRVKRDSDSNNINVELWLDAETKIEKQLKYADQKGIPFVIIIGPEEKEKNMITLKNMKTREQKEITVEDLIDQLQI